MLRQNLVTATVTIRRSVLDAVGGFDETIRAGMEDWEFWLRCAALGHWAKRFRNTWIGTGGVTASTPRGTTSRSPDKAERFSQLVRASLGAEG